MDNHERQPSIFGGADQTLPSTSSAKPTRTSVPSYVKRAVAELGLRYRPAAGADLEAHAARLALLVTSLVDMPEKPLRAAIGDWVVRKQWMPTAAEIIEVARNILAASTKYSTPAEKARAMLPAMNERMTRKDCVWDIDATGAFYLRDL